MPSKKHRVNVAIFKKLLKFGKRFSGDFINILYKKADDENSDYRFSVVVSKKIAKKAHDRNRIKRQVREIVKSFVLDKNIHNLHFVVFLKQKSTFDKFSELKSLILKDLENFLTRV